MINIKSKKRFSFANIAGICGIVVLFFLTSFIVIISIKIVINATIGNNKKHLIKAETSILEPEISAGSLCLYQSNIKGIAEGDIVVVLHEGKHILTRINKIDGTKYFVSDNENYITVNADQVVGEYVKKLTWQADWYYLLVSHEFCITLMIISILIIVCRITYLKVLRIKNLQYMIRQIATQPIIGKD